ncbi:PARN [Symbiodinium sp. CCMP2592]|nr:PARN [Symbiodinium sp. CCMP2592]
MEGRVSNFKKVLADFESRLPGADFVAIDTELTGVDLEGEIDSFDDSALSRLDRHCRIAERYTLIQLGLTLVSQERNGGREDVLSFASYNLFAFPYAGNDLIGRDQGFFCQASALQFNARNNVDFNTWIRDGIPYMSREDERRYKKYYASIGGIADEKVGLLRLWKALCARQLPFVVHCPLDLFFLLAAFERRPLPRNDPRAMAQIIRHCTPKVVDTAHLHGALGGFKRLGLTMFAKDAKARHRELAGNGTVPHLKFRLVSETASRYGSQADRNELAHEAGFDSLMTAQLFAYLRAISPTQVREGANRLFLYKSIEYLDLDRAALEGEVGACMFDLSRVTLLVAALDTVDGNDAPRLITNAGYLCKSIDAQHVLVVMRASGGAAVRKAAELAGKVHGVVSWMGFDEWRQGEAAKAKYHNGDRPDPGRSTGRPRNGDVDPPELEPPAAEPLTELSVEASASAPSPSPKETPQMDPIDRQAPTELPTGDPDPGLGEGLRRSVAGIFRQKPKLLAGAGLLLLWMLARAEVDSAISRLFRKLFRGRPLLRSA